MKIDNFQSMKKTGEKITMITCYDYWSACIIADSQIDCILVGDSLAMIMHGYNTTIPATIDMMAAHTTTVARGALNKFIIADMPFLTYRKGLATTMDNVAKLIQAGAHATKLEGIEGNESIIEHIVKSGVPVMGHLGLTPQFIHQLGGFKVQKNDAYWSAKLLQQAKKLQAAGCFAIVLECLDEQLASEITNSLDIPTIGIGAGRQVDGQVLVLHDLLGLNPKFKPKFLKTYLDGFQLIKTALNTYSTEVKEQRYPDKQHCYYKGSTHDENS